ncbi:MAG: hypothetical protein EPO26_16645 [Chloroflexota bacterium]|nr:MAG: hypothetical protein EPO26_16645 [Chloroflexota bacterium]
MWWFVAIALIASFGIGCGRVAAAKGLETLPATNVVVVSTDDTPTPTPVPPTPLRLTATKTRVPASATKVAPSPTPSPKPSPRVAAGQPRNHTNAAAARARGPDTGAGARPNSNSPAKAGAASVKANPAAPSAKTDGPMPPPPKPKMDPKLMKLALMATGLPITGITELTAQTDPDRLLGKAGQYAGKLSWQDPAVANAVGFAELFADPAALQARVQALAGAGAGSGSVPLVRSDANLAVLRLPPGITQDQIKTYQSAFSKFGA